MKRWVITSLPSRVMDSTTPSTPLAQASRSTLPPSLRRCTRHCLRGSGPDFAFQSDHALTDLFVANYSGGSMLEADLKEKVEEFNKTATQPQNATIAYDGVKKQFAVKAEVSGTALDTAAVVKAADIAILSFQPSVTLGDNELKKADILSTDARLKTAADTATRMCGLTVKLVMAGNDAGSIGPDLDFPVDQTRRRLQRLA